MISRSYAVTVKSLCYEVEMSRQNYYRKRKRRTRRRINEELLVELVRRERQRHPRIGTRKLLRLVSPYLANLGFSVGRDRLFEILRRHGLLIRRRRRGCRTTNSRHHFQIYSNLIKEKELTRPNQAWASDITYLRIRDGFAYLALVTDVWSRKVVGYDLGVNLEATGAVRALKRAIRQKPEDLDLIHHSDRGTQYCCHRYTDLLKKHGVAISMTEENHCYENALAERLNGILKQEYGLKHVFSDADEARKAVDQAIELYNNHRPHLSLNYLTPEEVHSAA